MLLHRRESIDLMVVTVTFVISCKQTGRFIDAQLFQCQGAQMPVKEQEHFLRKTKINELPQLLNILIGDMSVVGPRPQTQRCFDAFLPASQKAIVQVRPGLSGIGSIIFRDEEDMLHGQADSVRFYDEVIAPYKGALEEWYVTNQGLRTYLLCIGVTAWVVLNSDSNVVWRVFDSLPQPSDQLAPLVKWYKTV